jgi:hypothetical protein
MAFKNIDMLLEHKSASIISGKPITKKRYEEYASRRESLGAAFIRFRSNLLSGPKNRVGVFPLCLCVNRFYLNSSGHGPTHNIIQLDDSHRVIFNLADPKNIEEGHVVGVEVKLFIKDPIDFHAGVLMNTDYSKTPSHTNYLIISKYKGEIGVQLFDPLGKMSSGLFGCLSSEGSYDNCVDSFILDDLLAESGYPIYSYANRESYAGVPGTEGLLYSDIYSELYFSLVSFNGADSQQDVLDYLSVDSSAIHKWFNFKLELMKDIHSLSEESV